MPEPRTTHSGFAVFSIRKEFDSLPLAHQNASYWRHFDCGHVLGSPQLKDVQEEGGLRGTFERNREVVQ